MNWTRPATAFDWYSLVGISVLCIGSIFGGGIYHRRVKRALKGVLMAMPLLLGFAVLYSTAGVPTGWLTIIMGVLIFGILIWSYLRFRQLEKAGVTIYDSGRVKKGGERI